MTSSWVSNTTSHIEDRVLYSIRIDTITLNIAMISTIEKYLYSRQYNVVLPFES